MQNMTLMHVPKTGGVALSHALGRHVHRMGHETRLEDLPLWPPIITIVRDPVARWVSAYDMVARQKRHVAEMDRWPTASDIALDPEGRAWLESYWGRAFTPQVHWLRDAKYALRRCWYIAHTETLDSDFEAMRDALGATECVMPIKAALRNANQAEKSILSPEAQGAIRQHYAADYEVLGGL